MALQFWVRITVRVTGDVSSRDWGLRQMAAGYQDGCLAYNGISLGIAMQVK